MFKPPELKTHAERTPGAVLLTIESPDKAVEIYQFQVLRPVIEDFKASPPAGFTERVFDPRSVADLSPEQAREVELYAMQEARWVGSLIVRPEAPVTLSIPTAANPDKRFGATLAFSYRVLFWTRRSAQYVRSST